TDSVSWSSSDTSVATITSGGRATSITQGSSTISASGGVTGSTTLTVGPATLVSIAVTPANPSIAKGTTQQLTATGTYSDGSTQDLTSSATWVSSNNAVATVTAGGLASGAAAGTSQVSASSSGITGSTMLTVEPAILVSIAVTPANPSIAKGTTQQFTATGGAPGTSNASASSSGVSGSTTLTVGPAALLSIALTPANPSTPQGGTQQFTATGTYSDGSMVDVTSSATWVSSNTAVATITAGGLASATAQGTSQVSATSGGVTGSTTLTVGPATLVSVAVTPANPSIAKGTTQQFTATGTYSDGSIQNLTNAVSWSSSNLSVATITSDGLAN